MGAYLSSIDQSDYPAGPIAISANAAWTLGPLFGGWAMNLFLCGLVLSWTATYHSRSAGDKIWIKIAVAVAVMFEVLSAGTGIVSIIQHGINQDRSNDMISLVFSADAIIPTFGAVTALCSQSFFASRCFSLLPRSYRFPFIVVISPIIAAGFAGALGTSVVEYVNHGATAVERGASPQSYNQLYDLAMIWLWSNVAADVMISTLLLSRLYQTRKEVVVTNAEVRQSDVLIQSLMRLTFETAAVTTICASAGAICYVTTTETTNLSYSFTNILPGLYALSLLWALNSRHRVAQEVDSSKLGDRVQLVWNLGAQPGSPQQFDAEMQDIVEGRSPHLAVTFSRGSAPRKAISRLGHQVRMVTIDYKRRLSLVGNSAGPGRRGSEIGPLDRMEAFEEEEIEL